MARPFGVNDAKSLNDEHRQLLSKLEAEQTALQTYRETIKKYSDQLVTKRVLEILQDIPIEEINNRGKRSFRVKALRDNGYRTIADIAPASVHSISSVYGVSEDAAYSIKRIVNEMTAQARQGFKIHLSTDNKTKESSKLILSIYLFKLLQPLIKSVQQLSDTNRSKILSAISDIEAVNGRLKWLFSSKDKKHKAMESYCLLTDNIYAVQSFDCR